MTTDTTPYVQMPKPRHRVIFDMIFDAAKKEFPDSEHFAENAERQRQQMAFLKGAQFIQKLLTDPK